MTAAEMPLRQGEVERHYPVTEVARLLGMSRDWVYERIKDGTFVVANFGADKSKRRIPASSINTFIESHTYSNKKPAVAAAGQNTKPLGRD